MSSWFKQAHLFIHLTRWKEDSSRRLVTW